MHFPAVPKSIRTKYRLAYCLRWTRLDGSRPAEEDIGRGAIFINAIEMVLGLEAAVIDVNVTSLNTAKGIVHKHSDSFPESLFNQLCGILVT